jgi:hypothetical protein
VAQTTPSCGLANRDNIVTIKQSKSESPFDFRLQNTDPIAESGLVVLDMINSPKFHQISRAGGSDISETSN